MHVCTNTLVCCIFVSSYQNGDIYYEYQKHLNQSKPDIDIPEVIPLVDARSPGAPELLNRGIDTPVVLLDHEGADEESRPVEPVSAVHPHYVQRVLANVLPAYTQRVNFC